MVLRKDSDSEKALDVNLRRPVHSIGVLKNYYLEHYGLKSYLVNNYITFKSHVLNENPIPNRVVKGKEDWYFLGNHYNNVFTNSFGNDPFLEDELEDVIANLQDIQNYLSSKNIAFYVVIPPDKNSVYKEFLPFTLNQNPTKLSRLKSQLKDVKLIDLTQPLLTAKHSHKSLYLKTDTHWNDLGAYIGYSKVMDILNQRFRVPKIEMDTFSIESKIKSDGDLIRMINMNVEADDIKFIKEQDFSLSNTSGNISYYTNPNAHLKLMLFGDSFSNAWLPFFNDTFKDLIYIHKDYTLNKTLIEKEKPDIVIFEIIERNIDVFSE